MKITVALASILAGGGHNVLKKMLWEQFSQDGDFLIKDFTHSNEYLDRIHNTATLEFNKLYEFCYKYLPSELLALVTLNLLHECVSYLNKVKPDVIIATHFLLGLHFSIAKTFSANKTLIISCIPDFGSPKASEYPYNKRIQPDFVLVFDKNTAQGLQNKFALNPEQIILTGYCPRKVFYQTKIKYLTKLNALIAIKSAFPENPYQNIDTNKTTVLLAGGAGGFIKKAEEILRQITLQQKNNEEYLKKYQYFVICGDNIKFYQKIKELNKNESGWRNIFPFPWLDAAKYALIQYASDFPILVSIAPATMSELLCTECGPLLIYTTRGGQEIPNLDYVLTNHLGLFINSSQALWQKIIHGFSEQEKSLFIKSGNNFLDENQKDLKELTKKIKELVQKHYQGIPGKHESRILKRLQKNNLIKFLLLLITVSSIIISIVGFFGKGSLKKVKKVKRF